MMLRQELQAYFDKTYPKILIKSIPSFINKPIHIRFELGDDKENRTIERVNQSTERAFTVFNDTFAVKTQEIFVLIYEYSSEKFYKFSNQYLHKQFPNDSFKTFYNQLEMVNISDFSGQDIESNDVEKSEIRIIIGKLPVADIKVKNILNAIANTEMGFKPSIAQSIYFSNPSTDRAFQMYDDRGCFIWSDKADKIRDIYVKRNDWIVDYHRPAVDTYFSR